MVRAAQIAALVPHAAGRPGDGHDAGGALHQSRFLSGAALRAFLAERARALGFDAIGVTGADVPPGRLDQLEGWLEAGHHGAMGWMAERPERRASPRALWPEVKTVILVGVNYGTREDLLADLARTERGVVSLYARRRDYHDILKGRLKDLAGAFAARAGADVKVFVDTAPVLEKALAADSGLGWQGKSTILVSRSHGTWLFLGALYTTAALPPDPPGKDRCGSCTACLDICPTAAFPAPYVLDSRRCIAYLTIEHKGPIAPGFRAAIGNRVFGCDDCLAICPWNKFAQEARETRLALNPALDAPALADLAALDDAAFRSLFAGTPVKRTGRDRFVRNVLIAIGNSGAAGLAPVAEARLADTSALVRGMAVWALHRLAPGRLATLAPLHRPRETDDDVRAEWALALEGPA